MQQQSLRNSAVWIIALIAAGTALCWWLLANPGHAEKREEGDRKETAILVDVQPVTSGDYPAQIEVMGQVVPFMEAVIRPQVSGEIVEVTKEFAAGGRFHKGELLLRIDPEDYELAVEKQQAILQQAQADFRMEMGRQSIAREELAILSQTTGEEIENPELALRRPQLEQAQAEVHKAQAELEIAELNLARTRIHAPFDALITQRHVNLGDKVSSQDALATLVNTETYWVDAAVPVNKLPWLIRKPNAPVTLYSQDGKAQWQGNVYKIIGTVNPQSRLAAITLAVPKPLDASTPLILGDYVRADIEGQAMENVIRIPLHYVRDGARAWVAKDDILEIRQVTIVFEDRGYAYVSEGLQEGDWLVTSNIPVAVEGMKLRVSDGVQNER